MKQLITLLVNGEEHEVAVQPQWTLLRVLREEIGLKGTRRGCDQGVCGACTVLVEGDPINACLSLAVAMQGRAITTVEGLASDGRLAPVQEAFMSQGAVQCGFCTGGFLLSAHALLQHDPDPAPDTIRHALSGNLCRCTGYSRIVEAVQAAARMGASA